MTKPELYQDKTFVVNTHQEWESLTKAQQNRLLDMSMTQFDNLMLQNVGVVDAVVRRAIKHASSF